MLDITDLRRFLKRIYGVPATATTNGTLPSFKSRGKVARLLVRRDHSGQVPL